MEVRENLKIGLLKFILGNSRSSKLFKILREKNNLCYWVGVSSYIRPYMGALFIEASFNRKNLIEGMNLIKKILQEIKKDGVEKDGLLTAKNLYQRDIVSFNFETPLQIVNWLVNEELNFKKIRLPEDYMREVKKIKKDEIHTLTRQILDFSKLNIGLFGNLENNEVEKVEKIWQS